MSRSRKLKSTRPPTAIFKCCLYEQYIDQNEEICYLTCDKDADWTWYEDGGQVGLCREHLPKAWLMARVRAGVVVPVVRVRQNAASFTSLRTQTVKRKMLEMF